MSSSDQSHCLFCGKPLGLIHRWRTPGYCSPDHRQQHSLHKSSIFEDPVVAPPEEPAPEPELPAALRHRPLVPSRQPELHPDPLFEAPRVAQPSSARPAAPTPEPSPAVEPPHALPARPLAPTLPAGLGGASKPDAVTAGLRPPLVKSPEPAPPPKPGIMDVPADKFFKSGGRAEPAHPLLVRRPPGQRSQQTSEAPPLDPARRTGSE